MPSYDSDQPVTDSPSHQHACLLILDALAGLLAKVCATGGLLAALPCTLPYVTYRVGRLGCRLTASSKAGMRKRSSLGCQKFVNLSSTSVACGAEPSKASLSLKGKMR